MGWVMVLWQYKPPLIVAGEAVHEATRVPPAALLAVPAGTILGASVGESVQAPGKELGDDPSDRRRDHRSAGHAEAGLA